jgi:hypothetical protein
MRYGFFFATAILFAASCQKREFNSQTHDAASGTGNPELGKGGAALKIGGQPVRLPRLGLIEAKKRMQAAFFPANFLNILLM